LNDEESLCSQSLAVCLIFKHGGPHAVSDHGASDGYLLTCSLSRPLPLLPVVGQRENALIRSNPVFFYFPDEIFADIYIRLKALPIYNNHQNPGYYCRFVNSGILPNFLGLQRIVKKESEALVFWWAKMGGSSATPIFAILRNRYLLTVGNGIFECLGVKPIESLSPNLGERIHQVVYFFSFLRRIKSQIPASTKFYTIGINPTPKIGTVFSCFGICKQQCCHVVMS